jgi:FkbM family methyltransferase
VSRLLPRAYALAARAGVTVTPIAPGAVLLQRRRRGAKRGRYDVVRLDARSAVVAPRTQPWPEKYSRNKVALGWLFGMHLHHVLTTYRVDTVLDVGANTGQYARELRRLGFRGDILSFEPVPEPFVRLERAAERDKRWSAHQLALGREEGTLEMNVVPGTCSSALPATDYGARRFRQLGRAASLKVPVRRLDQVIAELLPDHSERRMYVKLDTQGFDLEVFAGTTGCRDQIVAMQSEMALVPIYEGMPRLPQALAAYEAAGFEVSAMVPVSYDHQALRALEYDCVLVRAEAR